MRLNKYAHIDCLQIIIQLNSNLKMFRIIIRSITNKMNYFCELPILATALSNKSNILTINNEQLMLKNFYSVKKSKGKE